MKIIDSKGRLLGLINIIDLVFILFLMLLLPTLYYSYKLFTRKPVLETAERVVPIVVKKIPADSLSMVYAGLAELGELGDTVAKIIAIYDTSLMIDSLITGDDRKKLGRIDSAFRQIHADLWVKVKFLNDRFVFKDEIFQDGNYVFNAGKRIDFRPGGRQWECIIQQRLSDPVLQDVSRDVSLVNGDQFKIRADVLFVQVPDSLRDKIKSGQFMQSAQGKIAVIRAIYDENPDTIAIQTRFGYINRSNPGFNHILADMELVCTYRDRNFYWGEIPLRTLQDIEFKTDSYRLTGTIKSMNSGMKSFDSWMPSIRFDGSWNRMAAAIRTISVSRLKSIGVGDQMLYQGRSVAAVRWIIAKIPRMSPEYLFKSPIIINDVDSTVLVEMDCRFKRGSNDSLWLGDQLIGRDGRFLFMSRGLAWQAELIGLSQPRVSALIRIRIPVELKEKIALMKDGLKSIDTLGNHLAEIIQLDSVVNNSGMAIWGNRQTVYEESYCQVVMTLKIECDQHSDILTFHKQLVKIGVRITVPFTQFDLEGIIIQIDR